MDSRYYKALVAVVLLTGAYWTYFWFTRHQQRAHAKYGVAVKIDEEATLALRNQHHPEPSSSPREMKIASEIENSVNLRLESKLTSASPSVPVTLDSSKPAAKFEFPMPEKVKNLESKERELSTPSEKDLRHQIEDVVRMKKSNFSGLINSIESQYGTHAVKGLVQIAGDQKSSFEQRYIALMTAIRLGGEPTISLLNKLNRDKNPFMRRGMCLGCKAVNAPSCSDFVERLSVEDPALIVREECLEAVVQNIPSSTIFEKVLIDPRNRTKLEPLPILYKALAGLTISKGTHSESLHSTLCLLKSTYSKQAWKDEVTKVLAAMSVGTDKFKSNCDSPN